MTVDIRFPVGDRLHRKIKSVAAASGKTIGSFLYDIIEERMSEYDTNPGKLPSTTRHQSVGVKADSQKP